MVLPAAGDLQIAAGETLLDEPEPAQEAGRAPVSRHVVGHHAVQAEGTEGVVEEGREGLVHEAPALGKVVERVAEVGRLKGPAHDVAERDAAEHRTAGVGAVEENEREARPGADSPGQTVDLGAPVLDGVVGVVPLRLPGRQMGAVVGGVAGAAFGVGRGGHAQYEALADKLRKLRCSLCRRQGRKIELADPVQGTLPAAFGAQALEPRILVGIGGGLQAGRTDRLGQPAGLGDEAVGHVMPRFHVLSCSRTVRAHRATGVVADPAPAGLACCSPPSSPC